MKKQYDCFNWESYTKNNYLPEMLSIVSKENDMIVSKSYVENNEVVFKDNLHTNWMEIYHQVIKSNPESVLEVGCGCAHHLINLHKLNPKIQLFGIDYSQSQINLGYEYFDLNQYSFKNNLKVMDFTKELEDSSNQYDIVFTQAVTMHLAHDRAIQFIKNMGKLAKSKIIMVENITHHDYDTLFKEALPDFERIYDHKYLPTVFTLRRIK